MPVKPLPLRRNTTPPFRLILRDTPSPKPDATGTVYDFRTMPANHLRYGENPHQQATFYGDLEAMFDKLHGKELSYNNLVDVDACVNLIDEFTDSEGDSALPLSNTPTPVVLPQRQRPKKRI